MPKKKVAKSKQKLLAQIKWNIPDNIITRFATNMTVQVIQNEFKISFFEINPDIRLDPNQAPKNEVRADCVASVIVTADRLPNFIDVLKRQLDLYKKAITQKK